MSYKRINIIDQLLYLFKHSLGEYCKRNPGLSNFKQLFDEVIKVQYFLFFCE